MPRSSKLTVAPLRTVGARVKKAKVVYDPSEYNFPKKRLSRSKSVSCGEGTTDTSIDEISSKRRKKEDVSTSLSTGSNQKSQSLQKNYLNNQQQQQKSPNKNRPNNQQQRQQQRSDEQKIPKKRSEKLLTFNDNKPPVLEPQVNVDSSTVDTCVVCDKPETKKHKLISCKDCSYKIHPHCLNINFHDLNLAEERWRCKYCKTCVVCDETGDAGTLLTCSVCVDAYHFNCHKPKKLSQRNDVHNRKNWQCHKCENVTENATLTSGDLSLVTVDKQFENRFERQPEKILLSVPSTAPSARSLHTIESLSNNSVCVKRHKTNNYKSEVNTKLFDNANNDDNKDGIREIKEDLSTSITDEERYNNFNRDDNDQDDDDDKKNKNEENSTLFAHKFYKSNEEIPNIHGWSCEQIANYVETFLPNEANIFREQEIDGASCLLLTRNDVVNGLSLKLGSALRLYSLVVALQTRNKNPKLAWM